MRLSATRAWDWMNTALEHVLTHAHKEEMISFMAAHPECFGEAAGLAVSDVQPFAWRAAWLLSDCMEKNDHRLRGRRDAIIGAIPDRADGHQRELLKILLRMELGERHESRLFDVCMSIWEQPAKSPSVRVTAFRFIVRMAVKYPELANELTGLTQDWYLETLSPGIRNSVDRMLRDPALKRALR